MENERQSSIFRRESAFAGNVKEGGYQPTKDPPARPPKSALSSVKLDLEDIHYRLRQAIDTMDENELREIEREIYSHLR